MLGNCPCRRRYRVVAVTCFNPMVFAATGSKLFCGLWYDDDFRAHPDGWRIIRRVETKCFQKMM